LTLENHQGLSTQTTLKDTVTLAFELLDEDAPQACEVILRAVISMTNAYNFDELTPYIDHLLKEKVKVFGLCNYGKLLSTRGQLAAFHADISTAIDFFDRALESFELLSDPTQRHKEILQTRIYRLFAICDDQTSEVGDVQNELDTFVHELCGTSLTQTIIHISGWGNVRRFAHHAVLRALATSRVSNEHLADKYLNSFDTWTIESEDHPWQLIAFYRALLLVKDDRTSDAQNQIRQSLEICDAHPDGTITWIGAVIERCAEHFGILPADPLHEPGKRIEAVQKVLPNAPIDKLDMVFNKAVNLSNFDVALQQLLPFNFR